MSLVEKFSIIDQKLILPTGSSFYIMKRKLHGGLLSSRGEIILFWPLEDKIHVFAAPCIILYISYKNDKILISMQYPLLDNDSELLIFFSLHS